MSFFIKSIGTIAAVSAVVATDISLPQGVRDVITENLSSITGYDSVILEAHGHFGVGGSAQIKINAFNQAVAPAPVVPPVVSSVPPASGDSTAGAPVSGEGAPAGTSASPADGSAAPATASSV